MSNFVIKTSKNTLFATARMPYGAYKALEALALAHEGKIGETADGFFKADLKTAKIAKAIKTQFDADYAEAHAAYVAEHKPAPKKDTKKSKKPSSSKKGNAKKMTLEEFVRANDLCTVEQAKAYGFKGGSKDLWNYKVDLGLRVGKR